MDRETVLRRPARARLLPGGGDGAGEAREHGGVQSADVDAQLQGVGRHDPLDAPVAQTLLDRAPLVGQVAAPVALDP